MACLLAAPAYSDDEEEFAKERERMVSEDIARSEWWGERQGVKNEAVLKAMRTVPRHLFVPEQHVDRAYGDYPLPIGYGQTISQPYIVAFMTELLKPKPEGIALEIGTGSGYQAAILAQVVKKVYTIEIVEALADSAAKRVAELGYGNIETRQGDGYYGWPEHGPFDAIIVTAAASHIPPPLIEQLKPGGRMVIPVGSPFGSQYLFLIEKAKDGSVTQRNVLPVRFVPLTRAKETEPAAAGKSEP
ncbi:MAG: protein-L-isoaspartate(D-aspartate) O-methyltransferase [Candidatus Hydrogenedentes bacterium]|nr:protein-L-isoaspartate(D-aspartate) O-methyltransferase [Candidatus Hydrogenedentota bacterium]